MRFLPRGTCRDRKRGLGGYPASVPVRDRDVLGSSSPGRLPIATTTPGWGLTAITTGCGASRRGGGRRRPSHARFRDGSPLGGKLALDSSTFTGPGSVTKPVRMRASECPIRNRLQAHARARHQRHGRRRGDRQVAAGGGRRGDVRGGPPALHRRDQRGRARREGRRSDRDRRHGLPRRGRGVDLQLAHPRRARSGLRVRRAGRVDRVHRVPRGGVRRRALRRDARACGHVERRHEPHDLGARLPEPVVQRHARRRDRDQRGALRELGLPGSPRDRRRGDLCRSARTSWARE